jgi:hypothetical protein
MRLLPHPLRTIYRLRMRRATRRTHQLSRKTHVWPAVHTHLTRTTHQHRSSRLLPFKERLRTCLPFPQYATSRGRAEWISRCFPQVAERTDASNAWTWSGTSLVESLRASSRLLRYHLLQRKRMSSLSWDARGTECGRRWKRCVNKPALPVCLFTICSVSLSSRVCRYHILGECPRSGQACVTYICLVIQPPSTLLHCITFSPSSMQTYPSTIFHHHKNNRPHLSSLPHRSSPHPKFIPRPRQAPMTS